MNERALKQGLEKERLKRAKNERFNQLAMKK